MLGEYHNVFCTLQSVLVFLMVLGLVADEAR